MDKPHLAIPHYQEVLKHRPDDPDVRTDMGTCFKRMGALAQARAEYERVLEKHPEHAMATFNLGVVSSLVGDTERAAELWERTAELSPGTTIAEHAAKYAAQARIQMNHEAEDKTIKAATEEPDE